MSLLFFCLLFSIVPLLFISSTNSSFISIIGYPTLHVPFIHALRSRNSDEEEEAAMMVIPATNTLLGPKRNRKIVIYYRPQEQIQLNTMLQRYTNTELHKYSMSIVLW
ncbi:hypothetical protein EDC01DRAFT_632659 [Geopyxis carbonaria]|nr:hypothetical protein EDC01DRAFT_632659 [Geopyxis carbonaria]